MGPGRRENRAGARHVRERTNGFAFPAARRGRPRRIDLLARGELSPSARSTLDNPLRAFLALDDVSRACSATGDDTAERFIYAHLNRLIKQHDLDAIFIAGLGGGGMVANTYLEGTYSEIWPAISQDAEGMRRLFKQFSFPGGIPSHVAPETPGSIHEGGELGYSLAHAFGAAFDNPDLLVACVVGDGEAETGPLAASWHSNKFLDPVTDGAVLPILHLNGYKIANPAAQRGSAAGSWKPSPDTATRRGRRGDDPFEIPENSRDARKVCGDQATQIARAAAGEPPALAMIVLGRRRGGRPEGRVTANAPGIVAFASVPVNVAHIRLTCGSWKNG
jgi:hypothetical protein